MLLWASAPSKMLGLEMTTSSESTLDTAPTAWTVGRSVGWQAAWCHAQMSQRAVSYIHCGHTSLLTLLDEEWTSFHTRVGSMVWSMIEPSSAGHKLLQENHEETLCQNHVRVC